jgi:5-methylcytosine-specific restriction endonuclease McrA
MRNINCIICNKEFSTNHGGTSKYCSIDCKKDGKRLREKLWARKFRAEKPEIHLAAKQRQYQRLIADPNKKLYLLQKGKNWRRKNILRARELNRNWTARHKDKIIARNASRRSNREPMDPAIVKEVFKRDNYICQYCGSKNNLSIDHKIPLARGGSHDIDNLCIACKPCNSSKNTKTPEEFTAYRQEIAHACSQ